MESDLFFPIMVQIPNIQCPRMHKAKTAIPCQRLVFGVPKFQISSSPSLPLLHPDPAQDSHLLCPELAQYHVLCSLLLAKASYSTTQNNGEGKQTSPLYERNIKEFVSISNPVAKYAECQQGLCVVYRNKNRLHRIRESGVWKRL